MGSDVLVAMALGLTLNELIMMYENQFPVLQQNENDTWYDKNGRIVFTCSNLKVGKHDHYCVTLAAGLAAVAA